MKPPKPIARQSAKPKRGTVFFTLDTHEQVILDRVKEDGTYFCIVGDILTGEYKDFKPAELFRTGPVIRSSISSSPKHLTEKQKSEKELMNEFFIKVGLKMPYNCMNCNKPLYASTQWAKRCCSAHILPKAQFPSVAMNEDNIVFMGADIIGVCNCHDQFDRNGIEHRASMPIHQIALERFELLKPHLSSKELVSAYTYLNIQWQ